jgi:hypothetical protein
MRVGSKFKLFFKAASIHFFSRTILLRPTAPLFFCSLPATVALTLSAGDVLLAHHCLAHSGGPHHGHAIRYMLYYRVKHVRHASFVESQALHRGLLWEDLEGAQATARAVFGHPAV